MYLIYGEENFLINQELQKIYDKFNQYYFEIMSDDSNLSQIIEAVNYSDLFNDKKIIVIKNNKFLFNKNLKSDDKKLINTLINSLKQNTKNQIVFIFDKLLKKEELESEIIKFLLNNAHVKKCDKKNDKELPLYIHNKVKDFGGHISNTNINLLISMLPNDLNIIDLEIKKLLAENKNIDEKIIIDSVFKFPQDNPFFFLNLFSSLNLDDMILYLNERVKLGEKVLDLINQVANFLILCSQTYALKIQSLSDQEIADYLKIHIFRIKIVQKFLHKIPYEKLTILIKELAVLDNDIKNGKVSETVGFKNFILNLVK